MKFRSETSFKVPFHDIDIMNIAWHGHYLKYFEVGRTRLMQDLGLDWPWLKDHNIAMPVVNIGIDYRRPLQYCEELLVSAEIREFSYPELEIYYTIFKKGDRKFRARGHSRQVYTKIDSQELIYEVPSEVAIRFSENIDLRCDL